MENSYTIYTDGGARGNPGEAAYGFVVFDKNLNLIYEEGKKIGISTNNIAEYMGVIHALKWILQNNKLPSPKIQIFLDSNLVASQLKGLYKVKSENLRNLYFSVVSITEKIGGKIDYTAIRREKNTQADKMVNLALDNKI